MFEVTGELISVRIENNEEREWGRVVLLSDDGRTPQVITGGADWARSMEQHKGKIVGIPVTVEVSRYGKEIVVRHDKAREDRARALAKREAAASAEPTEGAPSDTDAPPPPEAGGKKR